MRLTGGRWRGRRVTAPQGARPTGARLREALFSILGTDIRGARFLDLFAGSGIVALEALSRGAESALLVDRERRSLAVARRNADALGAKDLRVLAADLPREIARVARHGRWSLVFADPPYAFDGWQDLLAGAAELLEHGGLLVVEHASRRVLADPGPVLGVIDQRRYGESALTFLSQRQARGE